MARRYALAAYRPGPTGTPEFLLVATRDGRLTLPKGARDGGEGKKAAARREAREEAGVRHAHLTGDKDTYQHRTARGRTQEVVAYLAANADVRRPTLTDVWREQVWLTAKQASKDPRIAAPLARTLTDLSAAARRQAPTVAQAA